MKHTVCIHGHFYQPPRENPWTGEIELQESAFPYPNWNERITAECYAPNTASRILDSKGHQEEIVNNYAQISFNFGPTLLSWLARSQPEVYHAILKADGLSQNRFSGHGSALAQGYNHIILPLANARDKHTQVIWGIKDFEFRFKRKPEGLWLPETAVDVATLEVLAAQEIAFTILAPRQAKRIRKINATSWHTVAEHSLEGHRPYLCRLPSGKHITIFFYDGTIAQDVAFGGLLHNGDAFANRVLGAFGEKSQDARLVHFATDGESYGHHHRFGEMALSYCLKRIASQDSVALTVYGEFLAKHPPEYEVEIVENSSWSCAHGVKRWEANCGCHVGKHFARRQAWRKPLREGMNWLRDELILIYENQISEFCDSPWNLRSEYITLVLDPSKETTENFFNAHFKEGLSAQQRAKALQLLEMQRHAMLMYTSCGWFFDDIAGIEAIQVLRYAAKAIELAKETSGIDLENDFIKKLAEAPSNIAIYKTGDAIYRKFVKRNNNKAKTAC